MRFVLFHSPACSVVPERAYWCHAALLVNPIRVGAYATALAAANPPLPLAVLAQCVAPPPAVDCKTDPAKGCATCQAAPNTLWCATCATAGWIVNAAGSVSGWCCSGFRCCLEMLARVSFCLRRGQQVGAGATSKLKLKRCFPLLPPTSLRLQCEAPTPVVDCKSDPTKGCAKCQAAPN